MKFYKNTEFPKRRKVLTNISVEVIISDEIGFLYIGYYCYFNKKWCFYDDDDDFIISDFVWWYAPTERTEQF